MTKSRKPKSRKKIPKGKIPKIQNPENPKSRKAKIPKNYFCSFSVAASRKTLAFVFLQHQFLYICCMSTKKLYQINLI